MRVTLAVTVIFTVFMVCSVNARDNMKAFPPYDQGQIRYVIHLAEQDEESNYQVELIVGQTVKVDESNQYFFGGQIKKNPSSAGVLRAMWSASWGQWQAR
jgi:serine protease inhibitor ecotin